LLREDARNILADIWHVGPCRTPGASIKVDKQADKRAIEVARYVLPVAAATTMVHTLSGIVLHRCGACRPLRTRRRKRVS